ncbi:MAG: radical SAM protein [Candidatus Hodarchaeota archaeon]
MILTTKCNAHCFFCHNEGIDKKNVELDLNHFEKEVQPCFFSQFSDLAITGGEPLFHSKFDKFLDIVNKYEINKFHINTNGILLQKKFDILIKKVKELHVSILSSDDKVMSGILGIIYNIDEIKKTLIDLKNNGIRIIINRLIIDGLNDSIKELNNFIEEFSSFGFEIRFFTDYYNTFYQNKRVSKDLISKLEHYNYSNRKISNREVELFKGDISLLLISPCTPEKLKPPDYATAAYFFTPDFYLKRMTSRKKIPWKSCYNYKLPALP